VCVGGGGSVGVGGHPQGTCAPPFLLYQCKVSATMVTRHNRRLTSSPGSLQSLGNSACLPSVSSPTRQTLLCCRSHSPAGCGIR